MAIAHTVQRLTEAEYLEIERRAEFRSEFLDGEMFAMAGGTSSHSLIKCNLIRAIGNQLEESPCVVYNSDMRVKVQADGLYTYPDVSIACGEIQFEDENKDTLLNPSVIVEVFSGSGEAYDRGKKFEMYRQLPTLREYLLVSQYAPHIEQYVRQEGGEWLLRDLRGMESMLTSPSLGIKLMFAKVYAKVQFSPAPRRQQSPRDRA